MERHGTLASALGLQPFLKHAAWLRTPGWTPHLHLAASCHALKRKGVGAARGLRAKAAAGEAARVQGGAGRGGRTTRGAKLRRGVTAAGGRRPRRPLPMHWEACAAHPAGMRAYGGTSGRLAPLGRRSQPRPPLQQRSEQGAGGGGGAACAMRTTRQPARDRETERAPCLHSRVASAGAAPLSRGAAAEPAECIGGLGGHWGTRRAAER